MQCVCCGEYIEKRGTWMRSEKGPLPRQDAPCNYLPDNKNSAERQRDAEPSQALGKTILTFLQFGERRLECPTAEEENQCVEIQNLRKLKMAPIERNALANDHGAR